MHEINCVELFPAQAPLVFEYTGVGTGVGGTGVGVGGTGVGVGATTGGSGVGVGGTGVGVGAGTSTGISTGRSMLERLSSPENLCLLSQAKRGSAIKTARANFDFNIRRSFH